MPAPVISDLTGIMLAQVGETINLVPFATETPTSWACTNVPSGVSFNTTTGVFTGAPDTPGVSVCSLTATNGSGTSAPVVFPFKVVASALADHGLVEINYDLQTGLLTNPNISSGPQIYGKDGNVLGFALGIVRGGSLRTLSLTNVKVTLRDSYDQGDICTLYDAAPGAPLDALAPRYRLLFTLTADTILGTISDHEKDAIPNELAAKLDVELTYTIAAINSVTEAKRTSVSLALHLAKALSTP